MLTPSVCAQPDSGGTKALLVFLVATNGLIQFEYANPDYKVRLDPELLVGAAKIIFKK